MSLGGGNWNPAAAGSGTDKSLKFGLADTFRLAWADPDLQTRIKYVLMIFAIYSLCINIRVPIPNVDAERLAEAIQSNTLLNMMNLFGGRALQKVSILALGLNPYITASIIMQIMSAANPAWKAELREGGEFARRKQNQRTRALTLLLCVGQGWGLISLLGRALGTIPMQSMITTIVFWTAGAMFLLWLGEQLTERGIGNGTSMLIFAGIVIAFPAMFQAIYTNLLNGSVAAWQVTLFFVLFLATTWGVVYFTIAQRRIPIQHMRRQVGTKVLGGQTSYLPFSVMMVGVIPIIFAYALLGLPSQLAMFQPVGTGWHDFWVAFGKYLYPDFTTPQGYIGAFTFTALLFFFSYFMTAIQFNVDDITDNLKRGGSFIPGVRPGKQTKEFLDGVITRVTVVGAAFLSAVALSTYLVPLIIPIPGLTMLLGTSLLIMVSVALELMRQIEANLMMKQYGQ